MTKVREISWPEEYSDIKRIEDSMVCGICYDYMDTAVMTPCSHNYCSMCIRKYLHYKPQCPACFNAVFEKDLYTNRTMDVFIENYLSLREKLISLIQNRAVYNAVMVPENEEESNTQPVRPTSSSPVPKSPKVAENNYSQSILNSSLPVASTSKQNLPTLNFSNTQKPTIFSPNSAGTSKSKFPSPSSSSNLKSKFSSPTSSKLSKPSLPTIAKIFSTPKRKETATQSSEVDIKTVPCPVCSVDIPENHINVHLDACLKRETAQKEVIKQKPAKPKRPPLPKLVLRVMKESELKKKMKELGLPIQGDRRALENRFTRYSVIYNAECDKLDPRPIPDLIRQCEMEEKQERKMDCFLVSTLRLQVDRNAKEEKIDEAQKNYRMANKSSFDKLIEEVKNRRKLEKAQQQKSDEKSSSPIKSSLESVSETKQKNISNSIENTNHNPSVDESMFQDSDSEESCPLVHYQRDGETNFCSVNLNESSVSTTNSPVKSQDKTITNNESDEKTFETSKVINNQYEESTDDEIENSPVSKKSGVSLDKQIRESAARDMCNSIIDDFSFDEESLSEFINTTSKEKKDENLDEDEIDDSLIEINNFNRLKLQKSSNDERASQDVPDDKSDDAFPLEILNGDSFDEFVNNSHMASEIIHGSVPPDRSLPADVLMDGTDAPCLSNGLEKENDALTANENSQKSLNSRRPVRKRNRPARFGVSKVEEEDEEKPDDTVEPESTEQLSNTSQDTTLKRRRGRQKSNATHNTSDEVINPPKRPVRRRLAVAPS